MNTSSMEPMRLPEDDTSLDDVAFELNTRASTLAGALNPIVQAAVGDLVRSVNCYYSNLIEGHDTRPRDIERALHRDFAVEPKRRELQLEAVAHIAVQRLIDAGEDPAESPVSMTYMAWLHREFCSRLPPELLIVRDSVSDVGVPVLPGELRADSVVVGLHVPPPAADLKAFLERFELAYDGLSKAAIVKALPAIHHRFLWIHPFADGNGRVARLMSHALLKRSGIGSSLWAVSRGLARNRDRYRAALQNADETRRGDLDGRGSLSLAGLRDFSTFFLGVCVDQVDFMRTLLEPRELMLRMQIWCEEEQRAGRLPSGAFALLREALLMGEVGRGEAASLVGAGERTARNVVSELTRCGVLKSTSHKAPLRLGFPIEVVERWFPLLYPAV